MSGQSEVASLGEKLQVMALNVFLCTDEAVTLTSAINKLVSTVFDAISPPTFLTPSPDQGHIR